jgi:hypothetical protein
MAPQNYRRGFMVRRTDPKGHVRSDERLHEPIASRLSVAPSKMLLRQCRLAEPDFVGWLLAHTTTFLTAGKALSFMMDALNLSVLLNRIVRASCTRIFRVSIPPSHCTIAARPGIYNCCTRNEMI